MINWSWMLVHHILKLIYCEWSKQSQSTYHSTQLQPPPSSRQGDTSLLDNQSKYHLGTVSIEVILVLYISTNTSALMPMNYIITCIHTQLVSTTYYKPGHSSIQLYYLLFPFLNLGTLFMHTFLPFSQISTMWSFCQGAFRTQPLMLTPYRH